jgi:hypothetical protein
MTKVHLARRVFRQMGLRPNMPVCIINCMATGIAMSRAVQDLALALAAPVYHARRLGRPSLGGDR